MNADGTNVRQITHNTLWDEGPAWSPDGTKFAFSSGADDLHLDIWTMNVDGSDPRQLTTYPGRDESPDWGVNPHPARVGGTVPAVLSLQLGSAGFGAFTPGVARDYTASATGTVTSTAGNATLLVRTPAPPGHLDERHVLAAGAAAGRAVDGIELERAGVQRPAHGQRSPQHIGATDALRTGTYATHADVHAVDDGAVTLRNCPSTACSWPAGTCTHEPAGAKTSSAPWVSLRSPSSAK